MAQKQRFTESSTSLANIMVEQEKMKAELLALKDKWRARTSIESACAFASMEENDKMRKICFEMETYIRQKEYERNKLRDICNTPAELEVHQKADSSDIPRIMAHINRIKAENENLRRFATKGYLSSTRTKIGQRISHQETHRESSHSRSTSATMISSPNLRSSNLIAPPLRSSNYFSQTITQGPSMVTEMIAAPATSQLITAANATTFIGSPVRSSQTATGMRASGTYINSFGGDQYATNTYKIEPAMFASSVQTGNVIRKSHQETTTTTTTTNNGGFIGEFTRV
jgi:hypothetical protein